MKINKKIIRSVLALGAAVIPAAALVGAAHAAVLTTASVSLSEPRPYNAVGPVGNSVAYTFTSSNVTTSTIKCIKLSFNTAADGSGSKPTGLTTTGATFSGSYVPTPASWTVNNNNTTGVTQITYATGETPASASGRTVVLSGVQNGTTANTPYYLLVNTYNNTDCSTTPVDNVVTQFVYTDGQQVTIGVDATLGFTVAGVTGNGSLAVNGTTITNGLATTSSTIPFGKITSSTNKVAAQDLTVSTNSGLGYTVYTRYTGAPAAGSYTIDDVTGATNASPATFSAAGTEAFGYTTEDTTLAGSSSRFNSNKWAAFTTSNAEVAYNGSAVSNQTTRVGFQAGVNGATEPGSYTSTVIYTAVPVY